MQFVEDQLESVEKYVKMGIGHVFIVLGAHVRVLIGPINACHFNANFA